MRAIVVVTTSKLEATSGGPLKTYSTTENISLTLLTSIARIARLSLLRPHGAQHTPHVIHGLHHIRANLKHLQHTDHASLRQSCCQYLTKVTYDWPNCGRAIAK